MSKGSKNERTSSTLDRRTFLMGTAGLGVTVAAGSLLAGCATGDAPETVAPDSPEPGQLMPDDAPGQTEPQEEAPTTTSAEGSQVYFTSDISPEGLVRVYEALGAQPTGRVAVKLSTGEPGGHNFLQPTLIGNLVQGVGGTIVECNTAYGGSRSSTEAHYRVAEEHGFTAIADVDILDERGAISLPVSGGTHLTEDLVGEHFENYDWFMSLAHFKGHAMGGFGGAIKNVAIGFASSRGKVLIHSAGTSTTSWSTPSQDAFLESMAEAAKAVQDHVGENICYVNVMNRLSVDCDCDSHPAEPEMADIGVLASLDPVALDRACVDLVYAAPDGAALIQRMESRNGVRTLEHAEAIGLGSQTYELISLDA